MPETNPKTIVICQGELAASGDPNVLFSSVLGSCIATCLWDPVVRVGGMNHFLLPGHHSQQRESNKFGVFAMEALINEMLMLGAQKSNLVARLFGGALTFHNEQRIGAANVRFALDFLSLENIPVLAQCTGGTNARRVRFFPESGRAWQQITKDVEPLAMTTPDQPMPEKKSIANVTQYAGQVEYFK